MATITPVQVNNLPFDLELLKGDPFKEGLLSATAAYLSKVNTIVAGQLTSIDTDTVQPVLVDKNLSIDMGALKEGLLSATATFFPQATLQNPYNVTTTNEHGAKIYDLSGFKNNPFGEGFLKATAAYIAQINTQQLDEVFKSMGLSKIESDLMSKYIEIAQGQSEKISAQLEAYQAQQRSANFLQTFLGYMSGALLVVAGFATADPGMILMGTMQIAMQASGGQKALQEALSDNFGQKAGLEFLLSVGEAAVFSFGNKAKFVEFLSMELMMNNFWYDMGKATGMSDDSALGFSLFMGIATSLGAAGYAKGATTVAEAAGGGASRSLRNLIKGLFDEGMSHYENVIKVANLVRHALQAASGGMQIAEAEMLKKAADILDKMADSRQFYTLIQGMTDLVQHAMTITQDSSSAVNRNYSEVDQNFTALARMFRDPRSA